MPGVWVPVAGAPIVALALLAVALKPRMDVVAPRRLAVVRAGVAVGAFSVLTPEIAGVLDALTGPVIGVSWLVFVLTAAALAWRRTRRDGWSPAAAARRLGVGAGRWWGSAGRGQRLMIGTVGGLVLAELVVALLAEPNNFDSQTYHLPKVERWAAQGDLEFWPTAIHRQVTVPPGAEYLLLHLRLLTGGDAFHNLVQGAAGFGCLLVASRIVAQFGGGRRAQVVSVFLLATTPMVLLQATSTQTDLVAAAWTCCVATLVIDGVGCRTPAGGVIALGAAVGLTAVTKTSGLLGAVPLVALWAVAQTRSALRPAASGPGRATRGFTRAAVPALLSSAGALVGVLLVGGMLAGPFIARVAAEFGHPLGPPRLRNSVPMQRHDPASVLVNALRVGHTALDTPLEPLREGSASAITGFAAAIGVDPQDRATTFGRTTFPVPSWYPDEDRVAFPITGTLCLLALVVALRRPHMLAPHRAGTLRAYVGAVLTALLLYPATVKWQPWGNRLLLFALVLAVPVAALWLDSVLRRPDPSRRTRAVPITVSAVLAASALAGVLAVSYGFPRRLVGSGSVFTTDPWETRFLRRPGWGDDFRWVAREVAATDARRVGLVQQNDNWEYPWWLLLRDQQLVALQSVVPNRGPASPASVDVIVCTGDRRICQRFVPEGWTLTWHGYAGLATPDGPEERRGGR
jgi:hypothetical protein